MKAPTDAANSAEPAIRRRVVAIRSCLELDGYLSGNTKRKSQKALNAEEAGATWMHEYVPPRFAKRLAHALIFRANERLRGETEKQDVDRICKELALKFCGPKISTSDFQSLARWAAERNDVELLARLCKVYKCGVKPLFDGIDFSILRFWDGLEFLLIRRAPPFFKMVARGYTMSAVGIGSALNVTTAPPPDVNDDVAHKFFELPGLAKWREAAAAAFIAFIEEIPNLYSEYAKPTKEHPHRRQYQTYKTRRKRLDLRPDEKPIVTGAKYDSGADILTITKRLGGDVEIHRFVPTTIQHD